jgi:hypothetical protein
MNVLDRRIVVGGNAGGENIVERRVIAPSSDAFSTPASSSARAYTLLERISSPSRRRS